jgi:hypothetical protein
MLNLERMLAKCTSEQWRVDDLDWTVKPRPMSREDEIAIVQYFTDMAGIERLAKALFEEQRRRATDPTLHKIFSTFVVDEERHAEAAERLAAHYDVHHYRDYETNADLVRFQPHFLHAIRQFSAEVANIYVTTGELLLDVALLRSLNDYVDDDMSRQAMRLINRDESRHIAIDYHMVEYYSSPAYQQWLRQQPKRSPRELARAWWAFANMLYYAGPFAKAVLIDPMRFTDPTGRRMREAFKRAQLLGQKPDVAKRPFTRFFNSLQWLTRQPVLSKAFGAMASRIAGVPTDMMVQLHTDEEAARAAAMSYEALAEEALQAKLLN